MKKELISEEWYSILEKEFDSEYFKQLLVNLTKEYRLYKVNPSPTDVFRLFKLTAPDKVRVVIIGQDPYPFGDHADGIAFSSKQSDTPASLRVILREVDRDVIKTKNYEEFKKAFPNNDLTPWLKKGVFPINTCLTVKAGIPNSHNELGWQEFTGKVIKLLWEDDKPKVFIVWGEDAKKSLYSNIDKEDLKHKVLEAGHPATAFHDKDLFSGCEHFSKTNYYFERIGEPTINWRLDD